MRKEWFYTCWCVCFQIYVVTKMTHHGGLFIKSLFNMSLSTLFVMSGNSNKIILTRSYFKLLSWIECILKLPFRDFLRYYQDLVWIYFEFFTEWEALRIILTGWKLYNSYAIVFCGVLIWTYYQCSKFMDLHE